MTKKEESIAAGRAIVSSVFASYATTTLLLIVYKATSFETTLDVVAFAVQMSITSFLFYSIWIGRQWAKWTLFVLLVLGLFVILWATMGEFTWRLMLIAAYFASLPIALCFPDSVDAFLDDQRRKRTQPNQALQPTPMLVTPRADARVAPSTGVADL